MRFNPLPPSMSTLVRRKSSTIGLRTNSIKILGQEIQSPNQLRMVVELAHNLHFDGKTYCVKTGER